MEASKFTIIMILQLILIFFIIGQFVYFNSRIKRVKIESGNSVSDSLSQTRFPGNQQALNSDFQFLQSPLAAEQQQNVYALKLMVKKNWIVNMWRNETPVISGRIDKSGTREFSIPLEYGGNRIRILVLDQQQNPVNRDEIRIIYHSPRIESLKNSVSGATPENRELALTFDGGADDVHTTEILDILRQNGVRCTLFLTGKFIEKHPDLVRQMVKDGHEIANHTYAHPHLTTYAYNHKQEKGSNIDRVFLQQQLIKTDSIFHGITQKHLKPYWRAPFGEYNTQILLWAAELGYRHVRWSEGFDTYDWVSDASSKLYRSPGDAYNHFMEAEKNRPNGLNGIIVLMHLGSNRNNNHIFKILPRLIETLREKNYAFKPVSELTLK
ncbi:MAG: polysaccharide deacetylase family protein [Calditrichia bacterium]